MLDACYVLLLVPLLVNVGRELVSVVHVLVNVVHVYELFHVSY